MQKIKENFQIIIIVLLALCIIPIGYYFIYALPHYNETKLNIEREKNETVLNIEKEKLEQEQKKMEDEKGRQEEAEYKAEEEKNLRQEQLNSCLALAGINYAGNWDNACQVWKKQVDKAWADCRAQQYSWETDATNKERCKTSTPDYNLDANGTCLLSSAKSGDIEKRLKEAKDECYKRYPVTN